MSSWPVTFQNYMRFSRVLAASSSRHTCFSRPWRGGQRQIKKVVTFLHLSPYAQNVVQTFSACRAWQRNGGKTNNRLAAGFSSEQGVRRLFSKRSALHTTLARMLAWSTFVCIVDDKPGFPQRCCRLRGAFWRAAMEKVASKSAFLPRPSLVPGYYHAPLLLHPW